MAPKVDCWEFKSTKQAAAFQLGQRLNSAPVCLEGSTTLSPGRLVSFPPFISNEQGNAAFSFDIGSSANNTRITIKKTKSPHLWQQQQLTGAGRFSLCNIQVCMNNRTDEASSVQIQRNENTSLRVACRAPQLGTSVLRADV